MVRGPRRKLVKAGLRCPRCGAPYRSPLVAPKKVLTDKGIALSACPFCFTPFSVLEAIL